MQEQSSQLQSRLPQFLPSLILPLVGCMTHQLACPWWWIESKGKHSNWWQWLRRGVRHQPSSSSWGAEPRWLPSKWTPWTTRPQLVYWQCMKNPHTQFWREAPCYRPHSWSASHRYPQRDTSLGTEQATSPALDLKNTASLYLHNSLLHISGW